MSNSVQALCSTVKKIIQQLKPFNQGFSLTILTGKTGQGKKTLLRQSKFQHIISDDEHSTEVYYNSHGIIVELGESWLHQNKSLLQQTLKQLNRCHRHIQITGIILCVDAHELTSAELTSLSKQMKSHSELLNSFGAHLGYRTDACILITKLDALAGFCEFYQQEHATELSKPLGFSLLDCKGQKKLGPLFNQQLNVFTESLGQQVLNKVHPARSGIKRTLIREFPLQIDSLRLPLQTLIETVNPAFFRLQSIFFTSAEQGGFSIDQLNKKIQHEYALTIQDKFPLSNNYRAYFIKGALLSIQMQTKRYQPETNHFDKKSAGIIAGVAIISLGFLAYHHLQSTWILDKTSQEWLAYDASARQQNGDVVAIAHLTNASSLLAQMNHQIIPLNAVEKLKIQLESNKTKHIDGFFMPSILKEVESVLSDNQLSYGARYQTLKIYLMLGSPEHYQPDTVTSWFQSRWQGSPTEKYLDHKLALLNQALKLPRQAAPINAQLVADTRNYLKALPENYLYYAIAKDSFSSEKSSVNIKGFSLPDTEVPHYFTKAGFRDVTQKLPEIITQISNESWVLEVASPQNLKGILEQAYGYDYNLWWKNLAQKATPLRAYNYQDAVHLSKTLRQANSIQNLVVLIQEHTSPELGESSATFNQQVASQFTDLNLISESTVNQLTHTLSDMEKFLTTVSIVDDHGKTAFAITKSRFQSDGLNDPLSQLFNQAEQLPEPVASWIKQMASDVWVMLINDTNRYINEQWKATVYQDYINTIANRFPFDASKNEEVSIVDFNRFFANRGVLNTFIEDNIKPFLDTSEAQWKPKEKNKYVLPIFTETLDDVIRANIITNMFFSENDQATQIHFSLQKSDLDPLVASLSLIIGEKTIHDTQDSHSFTDLQWPQSNVKLVIESTEGQEYSLEEKGVWAFFKLLQKVTVQVDADDRSKLQVLFELGGNSGRYLLKAKNDMNPFTPGILNGFNLPESIT